MLQEDEEVTLWGKLKAQIIKQIFKDLGPKNLKGVQFFYLISSLDKLELQFISNSRDIYITIILKNTLFQAYHYKKGEKPSLTKYALDDFTGIGFIFENNKLLLDLRVTDQLLTFRSLTGKGYTEFVASPLRCDEDDEDLLIQDQQLRPEGASSMRLTVGRVGMFESILSYVKGCKLNSLWFRFDSVRKMLEVTDKTEKPEIIWFLKVEESKLFNFDRHMEFHSKTLACALNLLPNDSELILTFYSSFVLLDVPEKERNFTIKISSKSQEGEQ